MKDLSQLKMKNYAADLGGGVRSRIHWTRPVLIVIIYLLVAAIEKI